MATLQHEKCSIRDHRWVQIHSIKESSEGSEKEETRKVTAKKKKRKGKTSNTNTLGK
jgi:hypothetical protein